MVEVASGDLVDFVVVVAAADANLVANALVGAMAMVCRANFIPVQQTYFLSWLWKFQCKQQPRQQTDDATLNQTSLPDPDPCFHESREKLLLSPAGKAAGGRPL